MRRLLTAVLLVWGAFALQAGDVIGDIKASVKSNWRKIASETSDLMKMREERKSLPDKSFWFWETDKRDQDAKIRERLRDVRKLLLSTDAQEIMESVDDLDEDMAELDEDIREQTEALVLDPDEEESCRKKIAKLRAKKESLQGRRRELAAKVCAELRALGLKVSGEAAEQCLFLVNFGELIDGVIVAKNVACVVDNLRELMLSGDVAAAKRYFGMYLVMVDVQVISYEDYLAKSREGEWRQGVNRILAEATSARDKSLENARSDLFTAEQRKVFAHNAEINGATVRAAEAYLKVLDAHEAVIADKLAAAERVRVVVESSYETVNLAGDFIGLAKANQEAFDALLKLDLPPVEMFDDASVQQECLAITRKLKE